MKVASCHVKHAASKIWKKHVQNQGKYNKQKIHLEYGIFSLTSETGYFDILRVLRTSQ